MAIQNKLLQAAAGAGGEVETDDNFNQTTLLLHGDGTNGAQNNTFLDSSSNAFTVTRNGNATQGSFSPYGDRWSNYFDGNRDYIVTPSDKDFAFGAGDFTIEHWINCGDQIDGFARSYAIGPTYDFDSVGSTIDDQDNAGKFTFYCRSLDVGRILISTSDITDNAWHHIAVTRQSGDFYLYVDGVLEDTNTSFDASVGIASQPLAIGGVVSEISGEDYVGYISDLRVVKGTAVYTSDFTPPTGPLTAITNTVLLTCQSNRFKDSSSNDFAITVNGDTKVTKFSPYAPTAAYNPAVDGGSGYFDGVGDDIRIALTSSNVPNGTESFTIEGFFYVGAHTNYNYVYSAGIPIQIYLYSDGRLEALVSSSPSSTSNYFGTCTSSALAENQWVHFAYVRNGNNFYLFVNGALADTASSTNSVAVTTEDHVIGNYSTGSIFDFNGYISDFRVVKGTAVYTSAFTPPTAPLTDITNTELLCNFTNAGIFDSTGKNNIETVGNAQIDTAVKKFGTGSMEFDGTDDYLTLPTSTDFGYGTGDFTVEAWVYKQGNPSADTGIVEQRPASTNGNYLLLGCNSSGQLFIYVNSGERIVGSSSTALSASAWDHVAYVRSGTSGVLYLNGTSVGSWTDSTDYVSATPVFIGQHAFDAAQFNGYIDDLRITKGVARYTAAFTPPSKAFPDE